MKNKSILQGLYKGFKKKNETYHAAAKMLMENDFISPEEYPIIKRRILDSDKKLFKKYGVYV